MPRLHIEFTSAAYDSPDIFLRCVLAAGELAHSHGVLDCWRSFDKSIGGGHVTTEEEFDDLCQRLFSVGVLPFHRLACECSSRAWRVLLRIRRSSNYLRLRWFYRDGYLVRSLLGELVSPAPAIAICSCLCMREYPAEPVVLDEVRMPAATALAISALRLQGDSYSSSILFDQALEASRQRPPAKSGGL